MDELKPKIMRVVFKDSEFKEDVIKTNAVRVLLKQIKGCIEEIKAEL